MQRRARNRVRRRDRCGSRNDPPVCARSVSVERSARPQGRGARSFPFYADLSNQSGRDRDPRARPYEPAAGLLGTSTLTRVHAQTGPVAAPATKHVNSFQLCRPSLFLFGVALGCAGTRFAGQAARSPKRSTVVSVEQSTAVRLSMSFTSSGRVRRQELNNLVTTITCNTSTIIASGAFFGIAVGNAVVGGASWDCAEIPDVPFSSPCY